METDVYVVLSDWEGVPATVLGAALSLADAKRIADRDASDTPGVMWQDWREDKDAKQWFRQLHLNRCIEQSITVVPLDGFAGGPLPSIGIARDTRIATGPSATAGEISAARFYAAMDLAIKNMKASFGESRLNPSPVRVGEAAAAELMRSATEVKTEPDSHAVARLLGHPVVIDPGLPPDEIFFWPYVYIVGRAGGRVPPGEMIRIDTRMTHRKVTG